MRRSSDYAVKNGFTKIVLALEFLHSRPYQDHTPTHFNEVICSGCNGSYKDSGGYFLDKEAKKSYSFVAYECRSFIKKQTDMSYKIFKAK